MGKYGEIPVSHYTGIPNISIPLYEVKSGDLALPISLSYHAGGIKVEEIASSVGLGWSLNAGGVVSRSTRGLEDEDWGYFVGPNDNTIYELYTEPGNASELIDFIDEVQMGTSDGEPDVFFYNFAGNSGKYMYDQLGNAYTLPFSKLKISTPTSTTITITSEDGTIYSFQETEEINTEHSCSGSDSFSQSAWFLTSITSADGTDTITLEYDEVWYVYSTMATEIKYVPLSFGSTDCLTDTGSCLLTHQYRTQRLKKINFELGYVNFKYNNTRCDLVDDKSLDEIEIYAINDPNNGADDTLIKEYWLNYSFFGDNSDGCNRSTEINKRLKLNSVQEKGATSSKPAYVFEYDETEDLPNRQSRAQDHWGYFNGEIANQSLISKYITTINGTDVFVEGANREAYPNYAKAATLTKITYPTGGISEFTYEGNTAVDERLSVASLVTQNMVLAPYSNSADIPVPYLSANTIDIPAGGAEVKFVSVTGTDYSDWTVGYSCDDVNFYILKDGQFFQSIGDNWNGVTDFWDEGEYQLGMQFECSYAVPVPYFSVFIQARVPVLDDTSQNRYAGGLRIKKIESDPLGTGTPIIKEYSYEMENDPTMSSGVLINFPDYSHELNVTINYGSGPGSSCHYDVRTSHSNYPLGTTRGAYVGYAHVIEDNGENGETRYAYNTYRDIAPNFPYAPVDNHDFERGTIKYQQEFAKQGANLRKTKATHYSYYTGQPFHHFYGVKTGRSNYTVNTGSSTLPPVTGQIIEQFYEFDTWTSAISSIKDTIFDSSDVNKYVATTTNYGYSNNHYQLVEKTVVDSKGDTVEEKFWYPEDYNNIDNIPSLLSKNIVGIPLKVENYVDGYRSGGNVKKLNADGKPIEIYNYEGNRLQSPSAHNANTILPSGYEKKHILSYDTTSKNIKSVQQEDGTSVFYVWGYHGEFPIARLENFSSGQITTSIQGYMDAAESASDSDYDRTRDYIGDEGALRQALSNLRNALPTDVMMTGYTYDPLVGVTSVTDPKGNVTYYGYDAYKRLEFV
ncbi:hypothetical protein, partial [Flagellimonas taeanensis]|uniref:hypothetical protein n=1 Tax=Flagellimonas taeanensis TaxID=1005926 RepID=UPI001C42FA9D